MATVTALSYRRPAFNPGDGLFNQCLTASAAIGIAFLIVVLLTPIREQVISRIDQLPERFAKLIVDKPAPPPGPGGEVGKKPGAKGEAGPGPVATPPGEPGPVKDAAPVPKVSGPKDIGGRIGPGPVGPGTGAVGRARAEATVASLAATTSSLQKSLQGLSSSLSGASSSSAPIAGGRAGGRPRFVPGGRDAPSLASVRTDVGGVGGGGGGAAALAGTSVGGSWVSVGSLSGVGGGGGGGGGGPGTGNGAGGGGGGGGGNGTGGGGDGGGTGGGPGGFGRGSAPGVYRSNASLLAVIQRYAAGIQYCYGNELKRDPSLRGKLVVTLTVAASGAVTEARIIQNTIGSESLASCALSQIKSWRFPPIAEGVTTFQAPFVFTPPS